MRRNFMDLYHVYSFIYTLTRIQGPEKRSCNCLKLVVSFKKLLLQEKVPLFLPQAIHLLKNARHEAWQCIFIKFCKWNNARIFFNENWREFFCA